MDNTSPSPSCRHSLNPTYVQCASLRKIQKPILDSCHHAEKAAIEDFNNLLQDGDITCLSQYDERDVDISCLPRDDDCDGDDVLAAPIDDTSLNSDNGVGSAEQPASRPYVPFSVEEMSVVKTVECWSNCNVRVVGKLSCSYNGTFWSLESIGEEGGPFSVSVDMKLVGNYPPSDSHVQVFGEIQVKNDSSPFILAKFFRDFSCVDVFFYSKALEEVKSYVPHFLDKSKMSRLRSVSVEDTE